MANKRVCGWAPPQTPLAELTALPRPIAGLRCPTSKGKGREKGMGWEGKGEGMRSGKREGKCFTSAG